jgi:ADP-heptose:LPS heptosyltransferase
MPVAESCRRIEGLVILRWYGIHSFCLFVGVLKVSRILVSQLARMGDLTQSLYLLQDLVRAGGDTVSVLVDARLERFVKVQAPWLEIVYPLDVERYLGGFRKGMSWTGLWQALCDELRPLNEESFERVINLNYGKLPAAVTESIRGETPAEGFHLGREGSFGDPWVELVSRLVQSDRRWNRFHLIDVFRFHSLRRVPAEALRMRESQPLHDRSVLGFQIATRCEKRTWGVEGFVEVIRHLEREVGCEVLLLGEGRERLRAEHIARRSGSGRVRNLVGKTSLEDLVEILGGCDRLVSGDTGTLHLAAYLGVPCLALFFGPAYVLETGPYGSGHIVMQAAPPCGPCKEDATCPEDICGGLITPDAVIALLKGGLAKRFSQAQIYTSGFLEDWMVYRPLHRRQATREDIIGTLFWGSAGDLLGEPAGRLPSLRGALQFLLRHYEVSRTLVRAVHESLESVVPENLESAERDGLLGILRKGCIEMKEMNDAYVGEEPFGIATAAA